MSKNITAVSKVVTEEALQALSSKLKDNIWAVPSRASPNAEKLKDGAIQRASVVPDYHQPHVKVNKDKIGLYKRPELNENASRTAYIYSNPWDDQLYRHRVARIYQPQMKHVHKVPFNKERDKCWTVEFESWGTYKSPLMGWTSGTQDVMSKLSYKTYQVSGAVTSSIEMGWGLDIQYPRHTWHTKKNYSDNFAWKGPAKEPEEYD